MTISSSKDLQFLVSAIASRIGNRETATAHEKLDFNKRRKR